MGRRRAKHLRAADRHELFLQYGPAIAYVAVRDADGHDLIGAAFHVGEGVFVTARHVVEGKTIIDIATTQRGYVPLSGLEAKKARTFIHKGKGKRPQPVHTLYPQALHIQHGPFYHSDARADVAVFKVREIDPYTPVVPLGSHLDDWIGQADFMLSDAVILGYPPIPMTREPHLVAARAEVNAMVDVDHADHVHFIVSAMPRGGFGGGPALTDGGWALGLVTQSLLRDNAAAELGFMAVLSVEPILTCLSEHKLLPECQAEGWDDFWNSDSYYFHGPNAEPYGGLVVAGFDLFDDGKRRYIEITCDEDSTVLAGAVREAVKMLRPLKIRRSQRRAGMVKLEPSGKTALVVDRLQRAAAAVVAVFAQAGYSTRQRLPFGHDAVKPSEFGDDSTSTSS